MCPDNGILSAYLDGEIDAPWNKAIAEHLASCDLCRAVFRRLEETHRVLQSDEAPEWTEAMDRVRLNLGSRAAGVLGRFPLWKRRLPVPVPVAALVAALLLFLGVSLAFTLLRSNVGLVKITLAPAGGTEIQIAAPISNLESLLKSLGGEDMTHEDIITLPKNVRLLTSGQQLMGTEAEFLRKKK